MCELCSAGCVELGFPLEGIVLVRATREGLFMKPGQWGLSFSDDPFFIWTDTPSPDPLDGVSDDEIDAAPPEKWEAYIAWSHQMSDFQELLKIHPDEGYRLVQKGIEAGFQRDTSHFGYWLFNHLGKWLQSHPK